MSGMGEAASSGPSESRHAAEDPISLGDSLVEVHKELLARNQTEIVDWDGVRRRLNEAYARFVELSSRRDALMVLSPNFSESETLELGAINEELPGVRRSLNDIQIQYKLNNKSWRDYLDEPVESQDIPSIEG